MSEHGRFYTDRTLVMAHRGARGLAPENTLAAFATAIEVGADAIELDVQPCATGEIVVIHDGVLDRTTNGTGEVAAMTLEELRQLEYSQRLRDRARAVLADPDQSTGRRLFETALRGGAQADAQGGAVEGGLVGEARPPPRHRRPRQRPSVSPAESKMRRIARTRRPPPGPHSRPHPPRPR